MEVVFGSKDYSLYSLLILAALNNFLLVHQTLHIERLIILFPSLESIVLFLNFQVVLAGILLFAVDIRCVGLFVGLEG